MKGLSDHSLMHQMSVQTLKTESRSYDLSTFTHSSSVLVLRGAMLRIVSRLQLPWRHGRVDRHRLYLSLGGLYGRWAVPRLFRHFSAGIRSLWLRTIEEQ